MFKKRLSAVPVKDFVQKVLKRVEENERNPGTWGRGIATGFVDFDRMAGGLHPGQLTACLSRPAMGKTAFSLSVALNVARNKIPVLIFALDEPSSERIVLRLICAQGEVDLIRVRTGMLTEVDKAKMAAGVGVVSELPIYIDTKTRNVADIEKIVKEYVKVHKVQLVILDSLQQIENVALLHATARYQALDMACRRLKAIASRYKVAMLLTSNLSRRVENQVPTHRIYRLSEIAREEGNFENHASVVFQLLRDEFYEQKDDNVGVATLQIIKTAGPLGSFNIRFDREKGLTFKDF